MIPRFRRFPLPPSLPTSLSSTDVAPFAEKEKKEGGGAEKRASWSDIEKREGEGEEKRKVL